MKTIKLKTKSGKEVFGFDVMTVQAEMSEGNIGLCIYCGTETIGVEPDARKYPCESCDRKGVFGLEELVLMGYAQ